MNIATLVIPYILLMVVDLYVESKVLRCIDFWEESFWIIKGLRVDYGTRRQKIRCVKRLPKDMTLWRLILGHAREGRGEGAMAPRKEK